MVTAAGLSAFKPHGAYTLDQPALGAAVSSRQQPGCSLADPADAAATTNQWAGCLCVC